MMLSGSLALILAVQAPAGAGSPRAVVRHAVAAVEGDSAAALRERWSATARRGRADGATFLGLASLARLTYDYPAADRWYARARGAGDAATAVHAELGRAAGLVTRWHRPAADSAVLRSIDLARAAGDGAAESDGLILWARLIGRQAGADSALHLVERAAAVLPASERVQLALVRCLHASVLRTTDAARAIALVDQAQPVLEASDALRGLGTCQLSRAAILSVRGDARGSHAALVAAAETFRRARDDDSRAGVLQWLAYDAIEQRSAFLEGRRAGEEALRLARRTGNVLTAAWAGLNLAQLALRLGDVKSAARLTREASASFARLGDGSGAASAQFVTGDAAWLSGRFDAARQAYEAYGTQIEALGLAAYLPTQRLRLAGIRRELDDLPGAASLLADARRLAKEAGVTGIEADASYEAGLQHLAAGRWAYAAEQFRRFIAAGPSPHHRYDARLRRAEALVLGGRTDAGEAEIEAALRELDAWRTQFTDRQTQLLLLEARRFDFDTDLGTATLVDGLVRAGRVASAFRLAEAQRARHLYTQIARRLALADASGNSPAERVARLAPGPSARALGAALPAGTALLQYVTGRGGEPTTLFAVTRAGIAAFRLPPGDSLAPEIERFATLLSGGSRAAALATRLGNATLAPALGYLGAGVTRLVIVSDGPLHRLPYSALTLPGGALALERFEIVAAPSARVAAAWWSLPPAPTGRGVLALGDARYAPQSGLPRLAGTGTEARRIAAMTPGARMLLGAEASEAAFKRAGGHALDVLHLATHAEVEDDGILTSALFLAPGSGQDGRVGVEEIAGLRLNVSLVVLSACRTAGGALVHGEGVQGLTAPLLEAGARAVAATFWEVGDRQIVPLMTAFYRELAGGTSAGDALRRAKLELLRSGASPAVWASVGLTGDAAVRPLAGRRR